MINYEQWCRLKQLAQRDRLSAAQIARALGLAARTVRKWLKEPRPRKRIERASVLDPFKGQIMGLLVNGLEKLLKNGPRKLPRGAVLRNPHPLGQGFSGWVHLLSWMTFRRRFLRRRVRGLVVGL